MPQSAIQLVPAVDRAVRMLAELRHDEAGKGISVLARDLGIPKSSAFQIAATLVHHGFLECDRDTRRYRLGSAMEQLVGSTPVRADLPVLAAPHLRALAEETGLTALLGLPSDGGTVLAARGDSPEALGISAPVGFRLDAKAGAFGKVFATGLEGAALTRFLRDLPAYTGRSITAAAAYRQELERVRERGFATDFEEYLEGVRAVAAPVLDHDGATVAAVCVLAVAAGLKRAQLRSVAGAVRQTAATLSRDLGHTQECGGGSP